MLIEFMLILLKIALIISLCVIVYQDINERKVYLWILFAIVALFGFLHFQQSLPEQFFLTILSNIGVVFTIVFVLFLYAKLKLKLPFADTFGLGDVIFFLAIAIGFPTITFMILFSFSLFFSLILFLLLKKPLRHETVPLAGLQALFFSLILLLNSAFNFINLYQF